jgi:Tfp pilus assembly protein PilF
MQLHFFTKHIVLLIEQDPSDYLSYYKRATAYLSLGKTNSAIEDFTRILDLKPGFHQALLQRAKLYIADGEYSLAKQDLANYPQNKASKSLVNLFFFISFKINEIKSYLP